MADIDLTPPVVIWVLLAIATLGLTLYRKFISAGQEDLLHPEQIALEAKLEAVDRWGNALTVITVVVGLAMAGVYLYQAFLVHK
jgi:hypothetical protein